MKKFLMVMMACLLVFGFVSCSNSSGGGSSGGVKEYEEDYINIINSYWDGTVYYMGYNNAVTIYIPNASRYTFYVNGIVDDTGTYNRTFNTATLVSDDSAGKIVGTAVLTSNDTVYVSLNSNSQYPGLSSTARRR